MDKPLSLIQRDVIFQDGETVRASKLNAVFRSIYNAISALERIVGDVHDSSAPYGTLNGLSAPSFHESNTDPLGGGAKKLSIANLARLIGPAENLNPVNLASGRLITETIPSSGYKFKLRYQNVDNLSFSDTNVFSTLAVNHGLQADSAGAYWVDKDIGVVYSISAMSGGTVSYEIGVDSVDQFENPRVSTFNILPDPSQTIKCSVSVLDASVPSYQLTLPLCTHGQRNYLNDSTILSGADQDYQVQLTLPYVIQTLTSNAVIPANFLFVKDITEDRFISGENLSLRYINDSSFEIRGVALDTVHEFEVHTVGNSITDQLSYTMRKLQELSSGVGDRYRLSASRIVDDASEYRSSRLPGNVLPQYLHRDGSSSIETKTNEKNGMRGDL